MIKNYLLRHFQVFFYSLGQLAGAPFATVITIAVIGITLALPTGLYILIDNVQRVSSDWGGGTQISLFLEKNISESRAKTLAQKLRRKKGVAAVQYVSRKAALEEFKRLSGFGDAVDSLGENPLPPVLLVKPQTGQTGPAQLRALVEMLGREKGVDLAQLDMEWVKRLHVILDITRRAVVLLGILLGLAVLLIIGNTIRLAVLNQRDEIEVIKLIGGTHAFIRRPFLYAGMLQGLFGAIAAWLLIQASLLILAGPITRLAHLYASAFRVEGLDFPATLILLGGGGLLGWLGSRIAVGRHLREIEPT